MHRYGHAWLLAYALIYIPWFAYVERTVTTRFHIITMSLDLKIPFCEYFVIPYLLWFVYVAFGVFYFFFHDKGDYYRLCAFLFTGMTVFLIVSTIYPNGHYLRPAVFFHDNVCTKLVRWLYASDTATNLFPSIHVYNSLGVHIALSRSERFQKNVPAKLVSLCLCVSIILSTMFLKQHSVFDVLTAFVMAAVMYCIVYREGYAHILAFLRTGLGLNGQPEKKKDVLHDYLH